MSRLVRSELLKISTTRTVYGLLLALLAFSTIAIVVRVLESDPADLVGDEEALLRTPGFGSLLVLVLGILVLATEYRHGTITQTFLAAPVREKVIGAKLVVGLALGLAFGIVAEVFAALLSVALLVGRGVDVTFGAEALTTALSVVAGMSLWAALGVAVASLVPSRTAAIVLVFVWFFMVEPLAAVLLDDFAKYAPGLAIAPLVQGHESGNVLSPVAGALVTLAYVAALAGAGARLVVSRDVKSLQS